jgi:hypothetical protein
MAKHWWEIDRDGNKEKVASKGNLNADRALQEQGSIPEKLSLPAHPRDTVHGGKGSGGREVAQSKTLDESLAEEDRREAAPKTFPKW